MAKRRDWRRDEQLAAFCLYCRTPFGKLHARNPEIIVLASKLGRTPSAVAMKACNFASLDPVVQARGVSGLGNAARADRELWTEFEANPTSIAELAQSAFESAIATEIDREDSREAMPQTKVALSVRREESRIEADLEWQLNAPIDHEVVGNSAHFSREREGYFGRDPELDSTSQGSNSQKSEVIIPRGTTESFSLVRIRLVQTFFRNSVLASYENRCAISGVTVPSLLVASHIIPWTVNESRRADPRNGVCLNSLYDKAFGYPRARLSEYVTGRTKADANHVRGELVLLVFPWLQLLSRLRELSIKHRLNRCVSSWIEGIFSAIADPQRNEFTVSAEFDEVSTP